MDFSKLTGYLIVLAVSFLYISLAGIYDEVPSDVYIHLEFFKRVSDQLQTGRFHVVSAADLFSKKNYYWYHLPTLISKISQTDFLDHLKIYSAINVMILLVCIYEFSYWVFSSKIRNELHLVITALLSVLFFSLHFGINVFAYIRYYAIAPTILNYCIYLASIVCVMNYYRGQLDFAKFTLIGFVFFVTALAIHAQESLFIIIIFFMVSAILFINSIYKNINVTGASSQINYRNSVLLLFPVMLVLITGVYFYVTHHLMLAQIHSTKVISLSRLIEYGDDLLILNPFQQFYTVLTHWGLYIIVLYVFFYRRLFGNQPVLLAGMLIPAVTVFNPVFTDLFLRIAPANVLWRFLYMLPLYLIAARIVTTLSLEISHSWVKKSAGYFLVSMVFILLLPINTSAISLPYSRIYSLLEVPDQARPVHWQDMLDYLHELPAGEIIITDPVTGYMISALTKHHNRRHKFYNHTVVDKYRFDDYSNHPLKKYSGKILVINQREGVITPTAKIARHWNTEILKLSGFYNQALIDHVNSEPAHFVPLWQAAGIQIYRIVY